MESWLLPHRFNTTLSVFSRVLSELRPTSMTPVMGESTASLPAPVQFNQTTLRNVWPGFLQYMLKWPGNTSHKHYDISVHGMNFD